MEPMTPAMNDWGHGAWADAFANMRREFERFNAAVAAAERNDRRRLRD